MAFRSIHSNSNYYPISIIAHTAAGSTNGTSVTTSSIDTSTANLIIISISSTSGTNVPTDSKGNTWTLIRTDTASTLRCKMFYCVNPTVGTGHTFSTGSSTFPTICVLAVNNANATPLDQQNGNTTLSNVNSLASNSVTPGQNMEIIVTAIGTGNAYATISINSGFIISDSVSLVGSQHVTGGLAYKIQSTAGAENPTWSWTTLATTAAIGIVTFKHF